MNIQTWQHYKGEGTTYTVDWGVKVGRLGTTVSSVTWSVEEGGAVITGESLNTSLATATVTTPDETCSLIKLIASLADGQIDIHFFKTD